MSWRIFQEWFNVPPWKDAEYIEDDQGEKFWIYWSELQEDIAKIRIRYRSHPAGHVNLIEEDDTLLTLADIHVNKPYRGKGLGKQLMTKIIEWAKENGYHEICGIIHPREGVSLKYLQKWYKRQGFMVNDKQLLFDLTGKKQ